MPIHIFEQLKDDNLRVTFGHVKSIFDGEFVVIFSMPTCNPCNSLFDLIKEQNKLNVIKINIEKDICAADYEHINMVPYILHIKKKHFDNWQSTDNLLDHVNDNNRCIFYVNKTSKFIDDNELNIIF